MTLMTDTPQTAEDRRIQAAEHVKQLEGELAQLQSRRQAAAVTVETLNARIPQEERSGDAETLAELRRERREAAEVLQDLTRTIGAVERDLDAARAYLRACSIACQAETYNNLVEKQCTLIATISEAVETLTAAVRIKEELAMKQDAILGRTCAYPNLSPVGIRHAIAGEIGKRLEGAACEAKTPIRQLDWSSRRMRSGGDLEP